MNTTTQRLTEPEENEAALHDLVRLVIVAALAGALTGVVGGLFRSLLEDIYAVLTAVISSLREPDIANALVPGWVWALLIGGACMGISRWMVRLAPLAGGSGIQHVEGVFHEVAMPAPLRVLPIKFIGGLLAMAPGSALGREGPTVQMAAVIGNVCGEASHLNRADRFLLYTAVAGAGLAVAFNTPLAGLAFVNEEVSRNVTLRRTLVTLTAVATSMLSFWSIYGNTLEFHVSVPEAPSFTTLAAMTLLGALCGVIGAGYNRAVLGALNRFDTFTAWAPEIKAALIGMLIGLATWLYPSGMGGGENQVQQILSGQFGFVALIILFGFRWMIGPVSYAAGTPGGLFSPMLLLGAALGSIFAMTLSATGLCEVSATNFALIGMAGLFSGVVRAPLTGILLVIEMTGNTALMVPLLTASGAAVLAASLLHSEPIYDSLLTRMVEARKPV
jgi:CIC family chloride channel protein